MAKQTFPGNESDSAMAPSDVQITIVRLPRDRGLRRRFESHRDRIPTRLREVAIAVPIAAAIVTLAVAFGFGGSGAPREGIWGVREAGAAGVAAAYGYPPGCLRVRISTVNPAFARADFDPRGTCGYEIPFPIALFRRFDGEWHPVLYMVSRACPMPSIPAPVQRQLSLCPSHGWQRDY